MQRKDCWVSPFASPFIQPYLGLVHTSLELVSVNAYLQCDGRRASACLLIVPLTHLSFACFGWLYFILNLSCSSSSISLTGADCVQMERQMDKASNSNSALQFILKCPFLFLKIHMRVMEDSWPGENAFYNSTPALCKIMFTTRRMHMSHRWHW